MENVIFTVQSNRRIAHDVFEMKLTGCTAAITRPGQFVNIQLDGVYLRRPLSVCDCEGECLTLIYKVVGEGTAKMSRMRAGQALDLLTGLGNGYDVSRSGDSPVLVGGGVGVPPLYMLAKQLRAAGTRVTVVCGFNSADDAFYADEFRALGADLKIATADGSLGTKGFVTNVLAELSDYTYFYACGPIPMFEAMDKLMLSDGEYSFEERMGCGFGACMGCSCKTKYGNKRICKDGPVMKREEIVW